MIEGGLNGGVLAGIIIAIGLALMMLPVWITAAVTTSLAIVIIAAWSIVLTEVIYLMEEGKLRSVIGNLAWGAFGIALGALTGSIWVALIAWVLGSIGNAYISYLDDVDLENRYA